MGLSRVPPSASELPLQGSENLKVILIEGAVSMYLHEGRRKTSPKIYYLRFPEMRQECGREHS